jgi:hypothetical protein
MKPTAQALEPRVNAIGVKLVAASSTLLLLIPLNIESISRLQVDSSANTRVTCLAKAGFTLRSNFPEISTVATAEVNTLAFFAGASLTDLIGIVDSRTAGVPPAPLSAGDILHRRANPDLIFNDESDAIYLYEGADCSGKIPTLEEDVDQWNLLLNAAVTRYRAGKPSELFENYQPITLIAQNQIVARFLIKKSIASN